MITGEQVKAARKLRGLSQLELADLALVAQSTIANLEAKVSISAPLLFAIRRALERAGVIFVEENGDGPGVRLRKAKDADRAS